MINMWICKLIGHDYYYPKVELYITGATIIMKNDSKIFVVPKFKPICKRCGVKKSD